MADTHTSLRHALYYRKHTTNKLLLHISFSALSIVHTYFCSKEFESFVQHMMGVSPKASSKKSKFWSLFFPQKSKHLPRLAF
ncbi:hypothetical protein M441DRAFT_411724 [Trichoderma asperellum CBS 433.97]|uniref:Uncharacterized protein n=1 Tax=Trichoderma asperellum (strain ATCC 204424 / CBS 433.97 / NBRC 101777) TaxID=1042311 RepID=A0A2T3Z7G3_TRIA4|nr:hypothetical protein M441DRAFT_411724 [Trichoderma asperellum CBS 433.97]PTB40763.1 hypothetical protein M441DRAFT_411724 [Trichoderma asperellum CBS 433.97]